VKRAGYEVTAYAYEALMGYQRLPAIVVPTEAAAHTAARGAQQRTGVRPDITRLADGQQWDDVARTWVAPQ
jgi:hypothetical protein